LELREKINEGSVRLYIRKSKNLSIEIPEAYKRNLTYLRAKEKKLGLDLLQTYKDFVLRINQFKKMTVNFLNLEKQKGKLIHGYAASTKGNTALQFYGINEKLISAISDRNPSKWGKLTSGSFIPVISEEESRHLKPDYYFVLAWHFIEDFLKREITFLKNGGKFVVSMPEFKVIDFEESQIILNKK